MGFIYLISYPCLRLQFLNEETNLGQQHPVPAFCRILCSNAQGLSMNLNDLTVTLSQHDILLCCETLVSDMHYVSKLLVPGFGCHVLLCRDRMSLAREMAAHV